MTKINLILPFRVIFYLQNTQICDTLKKLNAPPKSQFMIKQDVLEQVRNLKPYEKVTLIEALLNDLDEVWFSEAENRFKIYQQQRKKIESNTMPL